MDKTELAQYVEKLKLGDIGAFEVIYNETNNQVYNLLYSYTKNEHTSFDLMQETYITVNSKIVTLNDPYAIKSWINRIAINKANKFFQKNKREILLTEEGEGLFENQLEEDQEFLPQEVLESKDKQRIIKDIVDNLPLGQKTAVYLYYFDELSLSEVAEDMRCSEGTVKSRLNYARKKIKAEVDTWEKKGTKLYGTGVPVLLLLLKEQLGIQQIDLTKADILLRNISKSISGGSVITTLHQIASANDKLSNTVDGAAKVTKRILGIKSAVAGGAATIAIAGLVFINKPAPVAAPPEPEIKKVNTYIAYSELGMDNGISELDVLGDDIVVANDLTKDQCVEIVKKDAVTDGKTEVEVKGANGKENTIDVEIKDNEINTDYESAEDLFRPYKDFTDGTIASVSDYDENIVQVTNEPDQKHLKVKALKEGSTTVKIIDDKGLAGELDLVVKTDKGNNCYISDNTSKLCK
ncbi:RNA polymerase sigma factor [Clostridium beijerinckii]|uniref:RNA polymerase sigma factor SigM n=1 Tax=Clostridium beijerinckii TaxID=1520 RepID=A0A1S8S1F6_CLOBE|nr:RNA polymerase sigma factor [Clostridium beijerinckii]NRY60673.1 RNA polymerase sigma factor (sigma-70 family) [Clostridium beijerinckii]OOM59292.1 RNA polymerase sigma factor SigM [Clostridium beijerinckii]